MYLDEWLKSGGRKPLVLRGARQVGKTWLIRDLAKRQRLQLVELNFERSPEYAGHFTTNDPEKIITNIEADLGVSIDSGNALLFLDEIQARPEILAVLRWFGEEMPELPVVAAGSLLDFALQEHAFSMPVGRISYFYLEPMSWLEFVKASGNEKLYKLLKNFSLTETINERIHQRCLEYYLEYILTGGMPEVVSRWYEEKNLGACVKVQQDLIATIRDDFNKYRGNVDTDLLSAVLLSVPEQLGSKYVMERVNAPARAGEVKKALQLLEAARICHRVRHTAGNGLPLGAESKSNFFKVIFSDVGLVSVQLGLSRLKLEDARKMILSNKGAVSGQYAGQQIRVFQSSQEDPALFYWQRIGGRQGEIDYIIQHGTAIVPIEVKAGARGSMKSLHQFMFDKGLHLAVRCDLNPLSVGEMQVKTTLGDEVSYTLLSIPLYLMELLPGLLDQLIAGR
jgi:uncharacterized protein